ncbi:MAG: hypothetical protein FWD68_09945 [Alphaproteobacteria bacterium]|nr:hypothetical protein [Alphaproteobacteria bacterium]
MSSFKGLERSLNRALTIASERHHHYSTPEHLLLALIDDADAAAVMCACGVDLDTLRLSLVNYLDTEFENPVADASEYGEISAGLDRVIGRAMSHALSLGGAEATGADMLMAILAEQESHGAHFLREQEMTRHDVVNYIQRGSAKRQVVSEGSSVRGVVKRPTAMAAAKKSGKRAYVLRTYCVNLNKKVRDGKMDPVIVRNSEISRAIKVLCGPQDNNPLFVGATCVGQAAIAVGLARRIVDNEVPEELASAEVFSLNTGALLAGVRDHGDFENRFEQVLKALDRYPGAILFIDDIDRLIGGGAMDGSVLLDSALSCGVVCMGQITDKEYHRHLEKNQALLHRFQKIEVSELSLEETIAMLSYLKPDFEDWDQLKCDNEAVRAAVKFSASYIRDGKPSNEMRGEIAELGEMLRRLRARDQDFRVFGSEEQGYRLGPPLSEVELTAFEAVNGVRLPDAYRYFLATVGDGGAGPFYGLEPLSSLGRDALGCDLSRPFLLTAATEDFSEEPLPGVLEFCHQGCNIYAYLVVNGPTAGTIWDGCDGEFHPTGLTFDAWYRKWLEHALRALENESLVAQLKVGMSRAEVLAKVGGKWEVREVFLDHPVRLFESEDIPARLELDEQDIVIKINPWPFI